MLQQHTNFPEPFHLKLIPTSEADGFKPRLWSLVSLLLLIASVLLWAGSLHQINLLRMDDLGLVSVLPAQVIIALFIINLSFAIAISQRALHVPLLLLHIIVLVFMLYGITGFIQEEPRFAIGWKLAGIIDYIINNGTVDGRIDAFFNWPTFFILMAFVTQIIGEHSAINFMGWAPLFFNLLYLAPLWMIYRSATIDKRLVMLGLWFFYLANWIGQDYLSPQAFNYFFFLAVLAILLTWLRGRAWNPDYLLDKVRGKSPRFNSVHNRIQAWLRGRERQAVQSTPVQRAALIIILVLILIAMVSGHQLTPFATLAVVTALVFFNRCTVLTLPVMLALLIATWILYMASFYIMGHIQHVAGPVGSVGSNLDANLTDRLRGSPGHLIIGYMRTGMSLVVWLLALLGAVRRLRNGYRDWGIILAALTPFPLLLLQAYGGELLLRIYLYSMPFMMFLGASLFFPTDKLGKRWYSNLFLFAMSLILISGFLFTRYGNERMDYFTKDEVNAVRYLYKTAKPGSQFVAATGSLPWQFQDYQTIRYRVVTRMARTNDVESIAGVMADDRYPMSYLILTRGQEAAGELFLGWPQETWQEFVATLRTSKQFVRIYANQDAEIFVLAKECNKLDIAPQPCSVEQH